MSFNCGVAARTESFVNEKRVFIFNRKGEITYELIWELINCVSEAGDWDPGYFKRQRSGALGKGRRLVATAGHEKLSRNTTSALYGSEIRRGIAGEDASLFLAYCHPALLVIWVDIQPEGCIPFGLNVYT